MNMRKPASRFALTLFAMFVINGCASRVLFTKELLAEFKNDLARIQFYISDDLILTRETTNTDRAVDPNHALKIEKGVYIEEIALEKSTPGILTAFYENPNAIGVSCEYDANILAIKFEPDINGQERFLLFITDKSPADTYSILSIYNKETKVILGTRYDGKIYKMKFSKVPFLMVDLDRIEKIRKERRTMSGIRLE